MRFFLGLGTLAAILASSATVRAEAPLPVVDPARLIEQLADADYRQRDRAFEQLRRLGPSVLPALRAAQKHEDAEVRRRVGDLIPDLEIEAALAPKRVTLRAVDQPLQQILDDLQKQTGYPLDLTGANLDQRLTVDLVDQTFWEALDALSRDAGLLLLPPQSQNDLRVRLRSAEAFAPFVYHSGPFRISADNLSQLRIMPLGQASRGTGTAHRTDSLTLEFTITSEPRLPLLGIGEPRLLAAFDSERNSMLPVAHQAVEVLENPFVNRGRWNSGRFGSRSTSLSTQVALARSSDRALSVRSVRGIVPVVVLLEQKPVVVADKVLEAGGKKVQFDKTTLVVESVTEQPNKYVQVQVSVAAENPEPGWANSLHQRFELLDAKGNAYTAYGSGWSSSGNHVRLDLNFGPRGNAALGAPDKLIFQTWTTMQYPLEFEFKDLPLP